MDKKYALYARVSTDEQTTLNQTMRLREYAEKEGFEYEVFEETMSTRKTRPVKQELLQRLRNNEYAGIIVYKLDRYARSSMELVLEVKELVDKGIVFISVSDNLDFGTAAGKLHFNILAAFCEFERSLISERTKEGLKRAASQGRKGGRPKGAKDKKPRRKSGYILKEARKRQGTDNAKGIHKSIDEYID